jgi:hypothetical protein
MLLLVINSGSGKGGAKAEARCRSKSDRNVVGEIISDDGGVGKRGVSYTENTSRMRTQDYSFLNIETEDSAFYAFRQGNSAFLCKKTRFSLNGILEMQGHAARAKAIPEIQSAL